MDTLKKFADMIDVVNDAIGRGVSWVTTLLVVVVFLDVVMRYALNISFVFTQELEWHLFGFIFLIGAGYTLLHNGHVRVDIIYQRLDAKAQAWINLVGCIVFLIPGCLLIIITSLDFAWQSMKILEGSPDPGGIPLRFIMKSFIPIGFSLFLLQGLSLLINSLMIITGRKPANKPQGGLH